MLFFYVLLFGSLDTARTISADTTDSFSSQNQTNTRSRFNIIWNCWTIIFICTWVSIHPNIPSPREKPLPALWRRAKLMLWALIVPELILAWAIRQWIAAKMIEEEFKMGESVILFGEIPVFIGKRVQSTSGPGFMATFSTWAGSRS